MSRATGGSIHGPISTSACEDGSALVSVLVLVTLMTVLVGAVMGVSVVQQRFVQRDVRHLQAIYAAEGCLHLALAAVREDPGMGPRSFAAFELNPYDCTAVLDHHGAFERLRVSARSGADTSSLDAILGHRVPERLHRAVILGLDQSALVMAGTTAISGNVAVGIEGVERSAIGGRPYRGRIDGEILSDGVASFPAFDDRILNASIDSYEEILDGRLVEAGVETIRSSENLHLDGANAAALAGPLIIVAAGDVTLSGPLVLPPFTSVIAGGRLLVEGDVLIRHGILYGRRSVILRSGVDSHVQVLSRGSVSISGDVRLAYPSFVASVGRSGSDALIDIAGESMVEGTVVALGASRTVEWDSRRVLLGESALVRGLIYSHWPVELSGSVEGSVLSTSFTYYESPSIYINWLVDTEIHLERRPGDYRLPAGFDGEVVDLVTADELSR